MVRRVSFAAFIDQPLKLPAGAAIEPIHGDYGAFEAAKVSHVRRQGQWS